MQLIAMLVRKPPSYRSELLHNGQVQLCCGDCIAILAHFPANHFDSIVTDPPYGLEFMGKEWDGADGFRRSLNPADIARDNQFGRMSRRGPEYRAGHLMQQWCEMWAKACLRVLKPGGHLVAFGGSRTYHRLACAIEDAGFEIRDQIQWIHGQGFPKNKNALKPAHEPIVLARKPLIGTVAENVLKHGTGGLNIDGCRVEVDPEGVDDPRLGGKGKWPTRTMGYGEKYGTGGPWEHRQVESDRKGRWPANVVTDGSPEAIAGFPADSSVTGKRTERSRDAVVEGTQWLADNHKSTEHTDSGSPSRFFYTAKADGHDRFESKHPTVKPVDLMQWLVRLITSKGGLVLDPFAGTGTTAEAALREHCRCVLIEKEEEYQDDIRRRLRARLRGLTR